MYSVCVCVYVRVCVMRAQAASKGRCETLAVLLPRTDIDLQRRDLQGRTALHHAVRSGDMHVVRGSFWCGHPANCVCVRVRGVHIEASCDCMCVFAMVCALQVRTLLLAGVDKTLTSEEGVTAAGEAKALDLMQIYDTIMTHDAGVYRPGRLLDHLSLVHELNTGVQVLSRNRGLIAVAPMTSRTRSTAASQLFGSKTGLNLSQYTAGEVVGVGSARKGT